MEYSSPFTKTFGSEQFKTIRYSIEHKEWQIIDQFDTGVIICERAAVLDKPNTEITGKLYISEPISSRHHD